MNLKDAGIYDLTNIFKGKATDAHGASQGSVINNKPRFINIPHIKDRIVGKPKI